LQKSLSSPDISIIVPVYGHWHLIPILLECIKNQTLEKSKFELLIVDNGSSFIPQDIELPEWASMLFCHHPGSYAARNKGIRHARGKILAFTDADCRPYPEWLKSALADYDEYNGHDVILAGKIQVEPENRNKMSSSEVYEVTLGLKQERYVRHGFGITANLFVPQKIMQNAGGFDEKRFSGADAEFCRRARALGAKLQYTEDAAIIHPARRTWKELVIKKRRVKGGQVTGGSKRRRFIYIIRTLIPPVIAWYYALSSKSVSLNQRVFVCWLQTKLWIIEIKELFTLLAWARPVRR